MKASIITKQEDLLLYIIPILEKFPKTQRFLLADKIENRLLSVLELLVEAYYKNKNSKRSFLVQVNIELEKTRHLLRLSKGLRHLSFQQYKQLSFNLDEIGKMNGAWLKSLSK